jgi:hypothetical protein
MVDHAGEIIPKMEIRKEAEKSNRSLKGMTD